MWGKLRKPYFFSTPLLQAAAAAQGKTRSEQHAAGVFVRGTSYIIGCTRRYTAPPSTTTKTPSSSPEMDAPQDMPSCRSGSGLLWTGLAAAAQADPAFAAVLGLAALASRKLMESPGEHKRRRQAKSHHLAADARGPTARQRLPPGRPPAVPGQSLGGGWAASGGRASPGFARALEGWKR
jgi:hypothetical protein